MKKKTRREFLAIAKFLIILNIFLIPFYAVLLSGVSFLPLQGLTADAVTSLLQSSGIVAEQEGLLITIPSPQGSWAAFINWDCSGWKSLFVLFALIAATPFALKRRVTGFLLLPVIYVINILRIWFMFYYVHSFGLYGYEFLHTLIWSWGMIFFILFFWLLWIFLVRKR